MHPDRWGTGVADELMKAAMANLPKTEVRLWVLAENHRAQRFYLRHGLRLDGQTGTFRPHGTELDFAIVRYAITRGHA